MAPREAFWIVAAICMTIAYIAMKYSDWKVSYDRETLDSIECPPLSHQRRKAGRKEKQEAWKAKNKKSSCRCKAKKG
jgi:hypothetical protein